MGQLNENFTVKDDGTIVRPLSDVDNRLLDVIYVAANKSNVLAAYRARKQCYKMCKALTHAPDYKTHVDKLLLENNPNEFKKAEFGKKFVGWLIGLCFVSALIISGIWCSILEYDYYTDEVSWVQYRISEYEEKIARYQELIGEINADTDNTLENEIKNLYRNIENENDNVSQYCYRLLFFCCFPVLLLIPLFLIIRKMRSIAKSIREVK